MKSLNITGPDHQYEIKINDNMRNVLKDYKKKYKEIIVVYDNNIDNNIQSLLASDLVKGSVGVDVDEKFKNLKTTEKILNYFTYQKVQRKQTLVVVIGGGVLLDMVGFACSIYMRGIDYISIPTTLLSMVDASVGSKTGIDFHGHKNYLGSFYSPQIVLINTDFLLTLSKEEIAAGMAEVIKMAYIAAPSFFSNLKELNKNAINWENIIYKSLIIKKEFVETDFFDHGMRQHLNFGHTFGHALESYYNFEKYNHGQAISIGMIIEQNDLDLVEVLKKYNLPTKLDEEINWGQFYEIIKTDKKNIKNQIIYSNVQNESLILKTIDTQEEFINKIKEYLLFVRDNEL